MVKLEERLASASRAALGIQSMHFDQMKNMEQAGNVLKNTITTTHNVG
jgi:NO-binding membrane sensor protein with MHYT domain